MILMNNLNTCHIIIGTSGGTGMLRVEFFIIIIIIIIIVIIIITANGNN